MANPLSHADSDPKVHKGRFYEIGTDELPRLKLAGYRKVGVGIALLNTAGEILLADHRSSQKVGAATAGITSETLGGQFKEGRVVAEDTVQAIARCLFEELNIETQDAGLSTRTNEHFSLSDWPIPAGKLLAINVALLMDDATAEAALSAQDTPEIVSTRFVKPQDMISGLIENLRPGTVDCLKSLDDYNLLDPSELAEAQLALPDIVLPEFDLDLLKIHG